jgi:NAD(P)-dependent dehydrogenase (short-subunit alcohol dehydrogenase family)
VVKLVDQLLRLDGRRALVTGAGGGIGAAIARFLADAGAHVIVADLDARKAEETAESVRRDGDSARSVQLDVADEASIAAAFVAFSSGDPLDILVNNAGIFPSARFPDVSAELFDRTIAINLRGAFLCTQQAVGCMPAGGAVINIASIEAARPSFSGLAHYGASKAGLVGLTRHLAVELGGHGIRVNAVLPASIDTPGARRCGAALDQEQLAQARRPIPVGRAGHSGDVAAAVLFLASPAAGYITGQSLFVDGGLSVLG